MVDKKVYEAPTLFTHDTIKFETVISTSATGHWEFQLNPQTGFWQNVWVQD